MYDIGNRILIIFGMIYATYGSSSLRCNLLLRKHGVLDGVGVFAGRDYKAGDIIESPPGVMVSLNYTSRTMLEYYTIMHINGFDDIVFGNVMMYNHRDVPSVVFQHPREVHTKRKGYARSKLRFDIVAVKDIRRGSEIFVSYGTDEWFRSRNMTQVTYNGPAPATYRTLPGCTRASIREHRGRIYTSQAIAKGEVLEVARALILPAHLVMSTDLVDYVWLQEDGRNVKGAVLVLGNGALYRSPSGGLQEANVNYTWFNEDVYSTSDVSGDLLRIAEATAPAHIECSLTMSVIFRASRDIAVNEELTVPIRETPGGAGGGGYYRQTLDSLLDPTCMS